MSYVEKNLINGEKILHRAELHWFIYAPAIFLLLIGCTIFFVGKHDLRPLGGILTFLGFWIGVKALIATWSIEMAITNKRVIVKTGLISRNTLELNHSKIESFKIDQSIIGRLFGYGTLTFVGTGATHEPIRMVDDPLLFRRKAIEAVDAQQAQ